MEYWLILVICIVTFAGFSIALNWGTRRSLAALSRNREPFNLQGFQSQMEIPVSNLLVIEVLGLLTPYVGRSFSFLPSDMVINDYDIDVEDLGDLIESFVASHNLKRISKEVVLPDPLTLGNLLILCSEIVGEKHPAFQHHT